MDNLNFILPEVFISLSIMFLLLLGVYKKNSSNIVHNLARLWTILELFFLYTPRSNKNIIDKEIKTSGNIKFKLSINFVPQLYSYLS